MTTYLLGTKREMTQIFRDDGTVVPVTMISVMDGTVVEIRQEGDHQVAVVGYGGARKPRKPQARQFGERGGFAEVRSVPLAQGETPEIGSTVALAALQPGTLVEVVGVSKGHGFQGVVKRHGFAGHPTTHGHKDQIRKSGSIGAGGVQRVFKGRRMAGRMGNDRVTVKNLEVMQVDTEQRLLAVKGAVPGAFGALLTVMTTSGNVWQK